MESKLHYTEREYLARHGGKDILDKAIKDRSDYVRAHAASNLNVTNDHLDKLANDEHPRVKAAVAEL